MNSHPFALYVCNEPIGFFTQLSEAQSAAQLHIQAKSAVRIESFLAPAPSQAWYWDTEVAAWIHARDAASAA
jgi:hypothetical protein